MSSKQLEVKGTPITIISGKLNIPVEFDGNRKRAGFNGFTEFTDRGVQRLQGAKKP